MTTLKFGDCSAHTMFTLFAEFQQMNPVELEQGNLQTYSNRSLILFFADAVSPNHSLQSVTSVVEALCTTAGPDHTTLSQRYKQLADVLSTSWLRRLSRISRVCESGSVEEPAPCI